MVRCYYYTDMILTPLTLRSWLMVQPVYRDASTAQWQWIDRQLVEAFKNNTVQVWKDKKSILAVVAYKLICLSDVPRVIGREWVDHVNDLFDMVPVVFVTNLATKPGFDMRYLRRFLRSLPAQGIIWFREDKQVHYFPRQRGFNVAHRT